MSEVNERGSTIERTFFEDGNRYNYDFCLCTKQLGWQQYDTDQDAWYFGVWIHQAKRQILTYAEGDETLVTCPTEEIFQAEIASLNEFHGKPPPAFISYDMSGNRIEHYDSKALFGRAIEETEPSVTELGPETGEQIHEAFGSSE